MSREPASGKERKSRSRAACTACRATKQKCDGPSAARTRCRRCELYSLECRFPASAGALYSVPQLPRVPKNTAPLPDGSSPSADGAVADRLFEISARLGSIEAALEAALGPAPSLEDDASPQRYARSTSASDHEFEEDELPRPGGSGTNTPGNPIQDVNNILLQVVGAAARHNEQSGAEYGAPDAIRRGLHPSEAQRLFDFFHARIAPWVTFFSFQDDTDAMIVRSRSSLLFHTILLLATAYTTPFPSDLHTTFSTYLNNIIAPILISPQPAELNTDFLRAVDLLNLWKPVQISARRAEGQGDGEAMLKAKLNGTASWMMQGTLARTAEYINLASVATKFLTAHAASVQNPDTPIPKQIVYDLRIYLWLLGNDIHGNVQSGRRCNMPANLDALKATRVLTTLRLQPYDVRLGALTEMFEIARPILRTSEFERTRNIKPADLESFNTNMRAWEEYWMPILLREITTDPLAVAGVHPFGTFIKMTFNASALTTWRSSRSDGPRSLSSWEWSCLNRSVQAAEALLFTLCEESRVKRGWRGVQWEEAARVDGWRRLTLDESVVENVKWAMDAITCIAYFFPIIFLTKLVNEGLLSPEDLVIYSNPMPVHPYSPTGKFSRLLDLAANFLDAVAMNEHHPAIQQAKVLRAILDAGLRGGQPPPPKPPRHASVVLSPISNPPFHPVSGMHGSHASPNSLDLRHHYQLQMLQMNGGAGSMQPQMQMDTSHQVGAVLDQVDLSVFGETAGFWGEWGGPTHEWDDGSSNNLQ